jgi:ABC-type glycerol-3-phosphate transport system substrate-binding protein
MNHKPDIRHKRGSASAGLLLLALLVLLAAAGCASEDGQRAPTPAAPTSAPPTAAPTAPPTDDGPITLVWWAPEFLSPAAPQPAGAEMARQLEEFSAERGAQVRVEVVRKARYGKGGLLDSLRTAAPVAPRSLPDVVSLDVVELEKAVEAGLLQPLNQLVDPGVSENLYAFASEAGQFADQLYALQHLADIEHVAFLPQQVAQAPVTWSDVVDRRTAYLFALASPPGSGGARPVEGLAHAVIGQYLSTGATLAADRKLLLEPQPLLRLLTFYDDATEAGVLPPASLELADGEAVWSIFAQGQAPLACASGRKYAAENGALNAGHAAAPGLSGQATPIAGGWALAIVTRDPRRQAAAAEFIAWLLRPENAGAWAKAGGWLPTSSGALTAIGTGEYVAFLDGQLVAARSIPVGPDYASTAERIQAAIVAVVSGESDAAAATEAAINGQP